MNQQFHVGYRNHSGLKWEGTMAAGAESRPSRVFCLAVFCEDVVDALLFAYPVEGLRGADLGGIEEGVHQGKTMFGSEGS